MFSSRSEECELQMFKNTICWQDFLEVWSLRRRAFWSNFLFIFTNILKFPKFFFNNSQIKNSNFLFSINVHGNTEN